MHRPTDQMPCHISDGPQTPEDVPGYKPEDEDLAYETWRQQHIDDHTCTCCDTKLDEKGNCPACTAKCVVCGIEWVDVHAGFDTCEGCTRNC